MIVLTEAFTALEPGEDEYDAAWLAAYDLPEAQRADGRGRRYVNVTKSVPGQWYANIHHEDGYVVWYMPGDSVIHALNELVRALNARRA